MQERTDADYLAYKAHQARRETLWNVPDRAKDAYIEMEDDFKPETVLYFVCAMQEAEE